jgi:hypothetical protein
LADESLFAQVDFIVVRGAKLGPTFLTELHVIETSASTRRIDMQFPNRERLIPTGSKSVGHRGHRGQR